MSQLKGVRFHLSGSLPDGADTGQQKGLRAFVDCFTKAALRLGATVVHGSHPTIVAAMQPAAEQFIAANGSRDQIVLVRAEQFASAAHANDIAAQRKFARVHVIPSKTRADLNQTLVPMREWMAERTDVVVAVGGRWWDTNTARAGVPNELEAALERGRPGFLVGGFGGAVAGYLKDRPDVLRRLRNGLTDEQNQQLANNTDPRAIADLILAQAARLPLVRQSVRTGRSFRILCLDGGGIRGTFTAAVLAKWTAMMQETGIADLAAHFDLIAGTSTGAILALALGAGRTPQEILDFYKKDGKHIFAEPRWFGSKFDSGPLRTHLQRILGDATLAGSRCRLVIPAVRATVGRCEVFVTPHAATRTGFATQRAVDVAMATAAAPTYFDAAEIDGPIARQKYLDGGLWANNPVLAAIAEAVGPLGQPIDRLDVLSVGTTGAEHDFTRRLGGGKLKWAPHVTDLFFAAQESAAAQLASRLVGEARHYRVDKQTGEPIDLAGVDAIDRLAEMGENAGQDTFGVVSSRFLDGSHALPWRDTSA